jgi:SAM-dependent methyltransferase
MHRSQVYGRTALLGLLLAGLVLVVGSTTGTDARAAQEEKPRPPDVVFVPTPQKVVERMLEIAEVKKTDVVYDLGCGDGRIPITAAKKYGCKAWGFDIDPQRMRDSLENVKKNLSGTLVTQERKGPTSTDWTIQRITLDDRLTIELKDIFTLDLSQASVITLYLLPSLNVKLIPQLEKCKPGTRIVSHDFDMRGVKPKKVEEIEADGREHTIYLWVTPLEKEKAE